VPGRNKIMPPEEGKVQPGTIVPASNPNPNPNPSPNPTTVRPASNPFGL